MWLEQMLTLIKLMHQQANNEGIYVDFDFRRSLLQPWQQDGGLDPLSCGMSSESFADFS